MSDLISKEDVLKIIHRHSCDTAGIELGVLELPTVETKPVVHGKWVRNKDRIYCNCCNKATPYEWNTSVYEISELISDFCPNCGADMRGKKND